MKTFIHKFTLLGLFIGMVFWGPQTIFAQSAPSQAEKNCCPNKTTTGTQDTCYGSKPVITPRGKPVTTCTGNTTTVTLDVYPTGGTYQWSDGSTTPAITVGGGNYTLVYTTDTGCEATDSVIVIEITNEISGNVFEDFANNGVKDFTDLPYPGVIIQLINSSQEVVAMDTTDGLGDYGFNCLEPDDYLVRINPLPSNQFLTVPGLDSNFDQLAHAAPVFALGAFDVRNNINAGIVPQPANTFGGFCWMDLNCDGIQDIGEPGLEGALVILQQQLGSGFTLTQSDPSGQFFFEGVPPGQYVMLIGDIPANHLVSPKDQGGDDLIDSDFNPLTFSSDPISIPFGGQFINSFGLGLKPPLQVEPMINLEGNYDENTGLMSNDLVTQGVLPTVEPLTGLGYVLHPDDVGITRDLVETDYVDWFVVELRDPGDSTIIVVAKAALIKQDGRLLAPNGQPLQFIGQPVGEYWLVIRHRNCLDFMSNGPVLLSENPQPIDFRDSATPAFGFNPLNTLPDGSMGMITGDANRDGNIQPSDKNSNWRVEVGQAGYLTSDFNLNGQSQPSDKNDHWTKNVGKSSAVP